MDRNFNFPNVYISHRLTTYFPQFSNVSGIHITGKQASLTKRFSNSQDALNALPLWDAIIVDLLNLTFSQTLGLKPTWMVYAIRRCTSSFAYIKNST